MKKISLAVVLISLIFSSCEKEKEDDNILSGTLKLEYTSVAGEYYIYLDNDTDPANGTLKNIKEQYSVNQTEADYQINTENVEAGSYYLYAGYDFNSDTNMDPLNPGVWEGKGFYGSNHNPPAEANVTDLSGEYNFTAHGLDK
ncbi:MAG: hypothetical protein U9N53_13925 [Bacteroidota bacterium]|nr:hypothetical protein [Bacteroidota bacterium]